MDIYTPRKGEESYPILVIYHGGGWLINDKSIMDQMSKYLATNSKYVICNVNYRLLSDNDNTITLNQTIEDAFGAILWIKDNIADYKGDKTKRKCFTEKTGVTWLPFQELLLMLVLILS